MNKHVSLLAMAAITITLLALTQIANCKPKTSLLSSAQPTGTLDKSTRNEVDAAIDRGLNWLAAQQKEDGSWSNASFPALTALASQTFSLGKHPDKKKILKNVRSFILTKVQKDGGIYTNIKGSKGGGLSNYNTAICTTALFLMKDKSLNPIIRDARKFIAAGQHTGDDIYKGGFGYDRDTNRAYTDLLNTFNAAETMALTASVEDSRPSNEKRVDIDWNATIEFIEKMQNKKETSTDDAGGFFYMPGQSKAGQTTNDAGVVILRSYGSMTYVGILSLLYADVKPDDPRVMSAFHWSARHWTLEENPGMGNQGLYFFYNILSKCLNTFGRDLIPQKDAPPIEWRQELANKLLSTQKIDPKTGQGYWINDSGRFWENDPILATAYALVALEML